jgi:uncharacterized membrane protein
MSEYVIGLIVGTLITNLVWAHMTYKVFVDQDDTVDMP